MKALFIGGFKDGDVDTVPYGGGRDYLVYAVPFAKNLSFTPIDTIGVKTLSPSLDQVRYMKKTVHLFGHQITVYVAEEDYGIADYLIMKHILSDKARKLINAD